MKTIAKIDISSKTVHYYLIASIALLFLSIHFSSTFLSLYGMDDVNYSRFAAAVVHGNHPGWNNPDHFAHRWIPIYFCAASYAIFGITIFSTSLFGLATTYLSCILLLQITKRSPAYVQYITVALYLLSYSTLFAAHRLWPDSGITFFLLATLYCYQQFQQNEKLHWGILFSVSIIALLVTNEMLIILAPALIYLFLTNSSKPATRKFQIISLLSLTTFLSIYLLLYYINTGNAFFRFQTLLANSYFNGCSFDQLPFTYTLKRVTYQLWQAFLLNGDAIALTLGLLGCYYRKKLPESKHASYLQPIFGILLLSSNFMSISFTNYVPLCQDARHFLFLLPLAAVCGAPLLSAYFNRPDEFRLVPIAFTILTIILFTIDSGEIKFIYLCVGVLLLLVFFLYRYRSFINFWKPFAIYAFFIVLLIRPCYDFMHPTYPKFHEQQLIINDLLQDESLKSAIVYANDPFTTEISEFLTQFDTSKIVARNLPILSMDTKPVFVLLDSSDGDSQFTGTTTISTTSHFRLLRVVSNDDFNKAYFNKLIRK